MGVGPDRRGAGSGSSSPAASRRPAHAAAEAIRAANGEILAEARARGRQMGSTVVALIVRGRRYAILWVGDSRAYLLRGGALTPLSSDHSQVQEMVARGLMTRRAGGRPSDGPYPVARGRRSRRGRGRPGRGRRPGRRRLPALQRRAARRCRRGRDRRHARPRLARAGARPAGRADARARARPTMSPAIAILASEPTLLSFTEPVRS